MLRAVAIFLAVAIGGFLIEVLPWVDRALVAPFIRGTTSVAGRLIQVFGGTAAFTGNILWVPPAGFAIEIDNGCSGLEVVILLAAAVAAFPANWRARLIGFTACAAAILALNVLRIISLFYIGQYSKDWFDWAHLYIWDALIMIDGLLMFFLWARWSRSVTADVR